MSRLTHFDSDGNAHMVDVSQKAETKRSATARSQVTMNNLAYAALLEGTAQKGDVLGVARIAGIMGAKATSNLIPLCHPLPIQKISIEFNTETDNTVIIEATVKTKGATGVEMEALTAASIAALTIYDMLKAVDKSIDIQSTRLIRKTGGKSGDFEAE